MRALRLILAAAGVLASATPAAAHDFWVQPVRFWTAPQAAVPMTLQVGHGSFRQRSPIPARRIVRFAAAGPTGAVVDLRAGLRPGGAVDDGEIRLPGGGTWVVVLQTDDQAQSHLPALRFNDYLDAEGLTPALEARRRTGRTAADGSERYSRQAKVLVRSGDGGGRRALQPLGLPLEIVPEADPYARAQARSLPVRVLYQGRPLPGALVKLTDLAHDAEPVAAQRTDGAGRAVFAMPTRGDWLLNVIWTRPLPPSEEVDFETTFSSLAFGLPSAQIVDARHGR
ncbi:MAG: DUF4198 domain-containing protein [Caulobacterales bacterium]|nr:DUF4198 domain-containing protein [Caulobacterales bacterium]